jgi:hypothetical protein
MGRDDVAGGTTPIVPFESVSGSRQSDRFTCAADTSNAPVTGTFLLT